MRFRLDIRVLKTAVCLTAILALFLGGMLLLRVWEEGNAGIAVAEGDVPAVQEPAGGEDLVWYNGGWYAPRENLELTLLLGIDNYSEENDWIQGRIFTQSDFMMLLIMDRQRKSCSVIHLNRDTLAEYRLLSESGRVMGMETGQLTLAHAYGGTEKLRCENAADAVSRLLYGVEINHYVSMMMDGVAVLNDIAGGVTLEVMDDMTAFDPELIQGEKVTLKGEQALTYLRSRMGLADATNTHRMERQKQYLDALQTQLSAQFKREDEGFILDSILEVNPYMTSDCTVEQLADLAQDMAEYGVSRYLTLEGDTVAGERFAEFHVDEAALQDLVMEQFYERTEG